MRCPEEEVDVGAADDLISRYDEKRAPRPRMAGESGRDYLLMAKRWSVPDQQEQESSIVQAFKELWDSGPTEEDFNLYVAGLWMFPRIFYYMSNLSPPRGEMVLG